MLLFLAIIVHFGLSTVQATCVTPGCQAAAAGLLATMDQTQNPCNNFYQFACGGFLKKNPPIGPRAPSVGRMLATRILNQVGQGLNGVSYTDNTLPKAVRTASLVYKTCMASITPPLNPNNPLLKTINALSDGVVPVGGWPMITPNFRDPQLCLECLVSYLQAQYSAYTLFYSSVDGNWGQPNQYSLYLNQGFLILPSKQMYTNTLFAPLRQALVNTIATVAGYLRSAAGSNVTNAQIMADANAILQFEISIARKMIVRTEQR